MQLNVVNGGSQQLDTPSSWLIAQRRSAKEVPSMRTGSVAISTVELI